VDPCCGTGTILIEATGLATGVTLLGTDHNADTIAAAGGNAATIGATVATSITWAVADAGRMPLGSGQIDRVVSNPPWDRQVEAAGALAGDPGQLFREIRRVLAPDGRVILLLHEAEEQVALVKAAGLRVRDVRPVSLFGAHPSIVTITE
jgi:23S rRNA G2445 N2-methylase RlmL